MSIEAMQWAFNQDIKPSSVKFVLVSLGDNAQTDGLAWPSIAALSQKTGQDRKTVMHALDRLEQMGYLADTGDRTGATGQIKVYRFNFNRSNSAENGTVNGNNQGNKAEPKSTENGTVHNIKEYRFSHQTVPNFPPKSTVFPHKSTENGTRNPQEPSIEPSGNQKTKRAKAAPNDFDAMAFLQSRGVESQTAKDWLTLRKGKRLEATKTAFEGVEREASAAGVSLEAAVRMCCERGWAGFKAEWLAKPAARASPGGKTSNFEQSQQAAQRAKAMIFGGEE